MFRTGHSAPSVFLGLWIAGCSCEPPHERDAGLDGSVDATTLDATTLDDDASADAAPDGGASCAAPEALHPPLTGALHPFGADAIELPELGVIVGRAKLHPREEHGLFRYTLASDAAVVVEDGPTWAVFADRATGRAVYLSPARTGAAVRSALFALDARTGERVRLSGDEEVDGQHFEVSPDGELVLYLARTAPPASLRDERNVYVARIDGSASARVVDRTRTGELLSAPRFAGQRVVFVAGDPGARALHSVRTDGSGLIRLDRAVPGGVVREAPLTSPFIVSPDGTRVVYAAEETTVGVAELHAIDADGTNRASLSGALAAGGVSALGDAFARLTPDGTRALFRVDSDGSGAAELRIARLDGSDVRTIAEGEATSERHPPAITPDGTRVVFVAPDRSTVRVAPLSGGPAITIASGAPVDDLARAPRVVGERVVYVVESGAASRLRSVRLDGGGDVLLHPELAPGGTLASFAVTTDGSWITYVADLDATGFALHRVRVDGSEHARISAPADPALSPPSIHDVGPTHVLYSQSRGGGSWALHRADLTSLEDVSLSERLPTFVAEDVAELLESDDGRALAYWSDGPEIGPLSLHLVRRDVGTACVVELEDDLQILRMEAASFDPAGDALYFRAIGLGREVEIHRAETATCAVTRVSVDAQPPAVFSPSGAIALHARRVGGIASELVATGPDGVELRVLSDIVEDGGLSTFRGGLAAFTADGSRVVYFAERGLYSVRVDGTERIRLFEGPGGFIGGDSTCLPALVTAAGIVFVAGDAADVFGAVMRVPADGSAPATRIGDPSWHYEHDLFSGCGIRQRADGGAVFFRVTLDDGTRAYVEASVDGGAHRIVVHEDVASPIFVGSALVYESWGSDSLRRLRAVSLEGGTPVTLYRGRSQYWGLPERSEVVFRTLDVARSELHAIGVDGSGARRLELPPGDLERVAFDTDGRIVLAMRGDDDVREVHAMTIDAAPSRLVRSCNRGRIESLELSRDGANVLVRADLRADGIVELYALPLTP